MPIIYRVAGGTVIRLPHSHFAADIYITGGFVDWGAEQIAALYLRSEVEPTVIDVGANIGYYSLCLEPFANRVIAVEPDPRSFARLEAATRCSGKIETLQTAISDTCGSGSLQLGGAPEMSSLSLLPAEGGDVIDVPLVTLDELANRLELDHVKLVKIDVEGMTLSVLQGGSMLTRKCHPVYLIECWPNEVDAEYRSRLGEFLNVQEYRIFAPVKDGSFWWTRRSTFREVDAAELGTVETKMLFLVPLQNRWFPCMRGVILDDMRSGLKTRQGDWVQV